MTSFLRRHWILAIGGVVVLLAVVAVVLAPWWIDLGPVRARIERAASSALAGTLSYERMELSWFPRPEVVVRGVRLSAPGVGGTVRGVRVQPALRALLLGRVVLTKLRVEGLDLAVMAGSSKEQTIVSPSSHDWTQSLRSLGSQALDVELSQSRVVLSRPAGESLTFEGIRLEAVLRVAEDKADVALSRLSLKSPGLALEGSLRADASAPRVEVAVHATALDVSDVRAKLLSFAGDDPVIKAIFGILRGGTLTSCSFLSSGKAPADLGALERMTIRAAVKDGKVRIPGPNLDLADVSADAALEGGVLTAENAAARVGKSRAEGGRVLVGLAKGNDRLRVDAQVRADLAEVPAILARAIPGRSFRQELALVEGLRGSATGRITIGDLKSAPATSVAVSDMRFSASYRRLPWPVEVSGGRFAFDGKSVGVSGLAGGLGRSTFSGVAARVRLGRSAFLENGSGSLQVSLEDFLEGVRKRAEWETLARNVSRLSGSVLVDLRRLSGPLARLDEASIDASGTCKEILFSSSSSSSLPPLSIQSGHFAVTDDAIRVTDADVRALDASLRVTGAWSSDRKGRGTIEASAEGELGPDAIRWGWERASLPAEFRPAAPIALRETRLTFASGGALALAGDFVVAKGPRLTLDLAGDGKGVDVRRLTVADGDNLASFSLRRREGAFDVGFKGRLAAASVAKLFAEPRRHEGAIEGDVRAFVPPEHLGRLTAEGTLTATNLAVPTPAGPVTVERLDARASGSRIDVASSSVLFGGERFSSAGSATLGANGVALDLGSFAWRSHEWKPLVADVRLGTHPSVSVREARVCGISTTGEARFLPGGAIALDARADVAGPDVNDTLTCLGLERVRMTGAYEASVQVRGEGPVSGLESAVRGPLTFKAEKGRIGKANVLTKILGVLNATGVFKSRTRMGEALPYDAITLEGEMAEGKVSIREAALKAPSITMAASGTVGLRDGSLDLVVLSHPLSTLDKAIQAVPVVNQILGRNFLAVGVKVTGSIDDMKAQATPARDIGKGLVGILERTVTLPVKVVDPSQRNGP